MAAERPTLSIFASDRGPGDAERSSIMSQAGSYLARKGARIACLAEADLLAVPLVTAARSAGGEVVVVADAAFVAPPALAGLPLERFDGPEARLARMAAICDIMVGLPGSLLSGASLYRSWTKAQEKPVVLLNRNRAYESMRGFAADIFSHSIKKHDRRIQFADSVEDMWNKISWLMNEVGKLR
jgi:predicted Rossmann-fold nucleotide-binding protein